MAYNETPTKGKIMENLTSAELVIYTLLKANPGMMHVTPDGNHIYFLLGEGENEVLGNIERISDGVKFTDLNGEELNDLMQDYLNQLFED